MLDLVPPVAVCLIDQHLLVKLAVLFLLNRIMLDLVCGRSEISLLPRYCWSIAGSADILRKGDMIAENLGNLFQSLPFSLTVDNGLASMRRFKNRLDDSRIYKEECSSRNSIAHNENGIVAPTDMSKSFWGELVEQETSSSSHESANCSQGVSHVFICCRRKGFLTSSSTRSQTRWKDFCDVD